MLRADPITGEIDQEVVLKVQKAMNKLTQSNAEKNDEYEWIAQGPDNIGVELEDFMFTKKIQTRYSLVV